jgi:hypothetical protein
MSYMGKILNKQQLCKRKVTFVTGYCQVLNSEEKFRFHFLWVRRVRCLLTVAGAEMVD